MDPNFITIEDAIASNVAVVRWLRAQPADKPLTIRNAEFEEEVIISNPHIAAQILVLTSQTEGHA